MKSSIDKIRERGADEKEAIIFSVITYKSHLEHMSYIIILIVERDIFLIILFYINSS